jgi:hypothetical protein
VIAISVKQTDKDVVSNYSVYGILQDIYATNGQTNIIREKINELKILRKQNLNSIKNSLIESGIWDETKRDAKTSDAKSKALGSVFYNSGKALTYNGQQFEKENQEYWESLRMLINENLNEIMNIIAQRIICANSKLQSYEFDGTNLIDFGSCQNPNVIEFHEHDPYYFNDNGIRKETAKLFYKLKIGEKCYRMEIRFKGNYKKNTDGILYTFSPQFIGYKADC